MPNNSDFAGPGGVVAEQEKQMVYPNKDQISKIEQELEEAEHAFRKASEAKSFDGMMQMHNRMCQLVAVLSAAWSGSDPTVFAKYFVPEKPVEAEPEPEAVIEQIAEEGFSWLSGLSGNQAGAKAEPAKEPAKAEPAKEPAAAPVAKAAEEDELPDISVLEKQLAELASKMQKCLEAGDMDGMLKANEGMGLLSEKMTQAEARNKEKLKAASASSAAPPKADPLAKITEVTGSNAPKTLSGGWAAGDTMALAKQRAEERKKQQKLEDSFESVVGELVEKPAAAAADAPPTSAVDMMFNDKIKARLKDTTQDAKKPPAPPAQPAKAPMTQEQLREKLESYNFYQVLSVPSTASFEELHKAFLKKIRRLNQKLADKSMEMWQFQEFVASLCLAHDVLRFPNARLQYDLVIFGTDGESNAETTAKAKMMPLKELLKFSTLIGPRELSEAIEKHKGQKDERQVGYYLVEKGLLSGEEFDSILFAQKLVSAGKLTVAQFELAMQEMRENSIPLLDTLVASEWIRPQDVFSADFL